MYLKFHFQGTNTYIYFQKILTDFQKKCNLIIMRIMISYFCFKLFGQFSVQLSKLVEDSLAAPSSLFVSNNRILPNFGLLHRIFPGCLFLQFSLFSQMDCKRKFRNLLQATLVLQMFLNEFLPGVQFTKQSNITSCFSLLI